MNAVAQTITTPEGRPLAEPERHALVMPAGCECGMCAPAWARRRGKSRRYSSPVTFLAALGRENAADRPGMIDPHRTCGAIRPGGRRRRGAHRARGRGTRHARRGAAARPEAEIGSLQPGRLADVALWRLDTLSHAGIADPVAALVLGPPPLELSWPVGGSWRGWPGCCLVAKSASCA
jgi:hypothetical protein